MQIPIESREENEELFWRRQHAKQTLLRITCSRKTCSQCPSCKHLSLSRKQALLHFQTYHPEEDSRQISFPRMNLHQEATCAKCKILHACNLIKLSCSNEMCEACLLDLIHCNEIETPDRESWSIILCNVHNFMCKIINSVIRIHTYISWM